MRLIRTAEPTDQEQSIAVPVIRGLLPATIPVTAEMRAGLATQEKALYQQISAQYADRAHGRHNSPGRQSASATASPDGQRYKLPQVQGTITHGTGGMQ